MSTRDNVASITKAYEAFKRGDIQSVLADVAENIDWTVLGQKEIVPFAGHYRGRDEVTKFFKTLLDNEDILDFEPREFVAEGDSVVVSLYYRARVKATGRTYEGEGIHLFHFRDGKLASFKEFADTARMASAYKAA